MEEGGSQTAGTGGKTERHIMQTTTTYASEKLTLRDTDFMSMMQRRIFHVLLVANPYDAFMLEDDGRIDEKLFEEYSKLGLRYPPRFFRAASRDEAVALMEERQFDLVICMPATDSNDVFDIARDIKVTSPQVLSLIHI